MFSYGITNSLGYSLTILTSLTFGKMKMKVGSYIDMVKQPS